MRARELVPRSIVDAFNGWNERRFARRYYGRREQTWHDTRWLGTRVYKVPGDLWIYQELLHELRPDLIVETGTAEGGSAIYLAAVCDLLDHGRIISIDIDERDRPTHARVQYVTGSSVAPDTLELVRTSANDAGTVLVILDSDHGRDHVLAELRAYAPLVTPGSYLIVEDTNVNGHPVYPSHGPGPWEAVDEFLAETSDFRPDRSREKFMLTFNPRGYLRRRDSTGFADSVSGRPPR